MVYNIIKFVHLLSVIFMSVPLYNLVVVHERRRLGKSPFLVDRYFENIIKGAAIRCYVYQFSALVTGLLLIPLSGLTWSDLLTNPILLLKLLLLLSLTALLSVVHFKLQPAIEALLAQVQGDEMPEAIFKQIAPIRLKRTRLATFCLFLVITLVVLGLQVVSRFGLLATVILLILGALFSWRVYKSPVRFGWI
ncbi:MAG: hypothetical protein HY730_03350 [Candidatus Tectomicrobia bacterium]|uniref:Uncharacterized protein n=1 Tax=Tectimicrobiota bacterium TaxID=2528274 RepID=A0A933LQK0_UNCTE|nr:hypothetical protein [Candidatus Tectomicrobia bacterium]